MGCHRSRSARVAASGAAYRQPNPPARVGAPAPPLPSVVARPSPLHKAAAPAPEPSLPRLPPPAVTAAEPTRTPATWAIFVEDMSARVHSPTATDGGTASPPVTAPPTNPYAATPSEGRATSPPSAAAPAEVGAAAAASPDPPASAPSLWAVYRSGGRRPPPPPDVAARTSTDSAQVALPDPPTSPRLSPTRAATHRLASRPPLLALHQ
jgi:hypothetical protein